MLLPLVFAVPLLAGLAIALLGHWLPEQLVDGLSIGGALAGVGLAAALLAESSSRPAVSWFGGWRPRPGRFPLGVAFVGDRASAWLALIAYGLIAAALVYSWRYLEDAHHLYATGMLVWGASMAGFALSADLFNLVVFLELMGVAAYGLTAYKVEDASPPQAAFNFGAINTVGSLLVLLGIGLLYSRTGALNLAELGRRLAEQGRHDGLVLAALCLLLCGFLVKAAIVPFHFWLADAYAAAPAPVCAVLGAIMSDLGVYAIARIYWTVFAGALAPHGPAVRDLLLGLGAATALLGAAMAMVQRHLKRLLAFATIADLGCFLIGVGLLNGDGVAGVGVWMLAHACAKAALFLVAGLLLVRYGEIDELLLRGRGRRLPLAAAVWFGAALALAGPPFVGAFTGHSLVDAAARAAGAGWVPAVLAASTIVSTGAILRAGGRVFLGLGDEDDPLLSREPAEAPGPSHHARPNLMLGVCVALVALGLAVGASSGLVAHARGAGADLVDRPAYARLVLDGSATAAAAGRALPVTGGDVAWALGILAGSLAFGVLGLYRSRLPRLVLRVLAAVTHPLQRLHSGRIGDYVAWLTFGTALVGGVFALAIR